MAKKSPARARAKPKSKSSSPKEKKQAPARGRRSRVSAKDKEEQEEEQAEEEDKEDEDEEESKEGEKEGEEGDEEGKEGDEEGEEGEEEGKEGEEDDKEEAPAAATSAAAATDEEEASAVAEPVDESEPADDEKPVDEEMVDDSDRVDTAPAADLQTQPAPASQAQPAPASHADNSVSPPGDRKRKFDEIEDESDDADEDAVKILKVCEASDVKTTASIEAPMDGEMSGVDATIEPDVTAESKFTLPLSGETDIEDDYVVITPDEVPPVDSDEVLNTAAKMVPDLSVTASSSCSNDALDAVDIPNPLLHREYVANPAILAGPADTARCFTLGSYNILADYHAQKDYGHGRAPWLTAEQVALSSRHRRLIEELVYLDEDIICLQEVGGDYMHDTLQPTLER